MLLSEGKYYLVATKCDLIEWIEVWALIKAINKNITKFIKEEFVYYYNGYEILVIDRDSENKLLVSDLIRKFRIKRKIISAYYL